MVEVNMSVHLCEEVPKAKLISRFTFSPRECMGELDTLKMMMCSHANLGWEAEDLENYQIMLNPSFLVLDMDCIKDDDTLILK